MAVTFNCSCGQPLTAADEHAGRQVQCPKCGQMTAVPHALWVEPVDVNDESVPPRARPPAELGPRKATRSRMRDDDLPEKPSKRRGLLIGLVGLCLMALAAVWLIAGIVVLEVVFLYPPMIFLVGLVMLVVGLVNGLTRSE